MFCSDISIHDNTIYKPVIGIRNIHSNNTLCFKNTIVNSSSYGILLQNSFSNSYFNNSVYNSSSYSIYLSNCGENTISWNNFIDYISSKTGSKAFSGTSSSQNTFVSNYWSDWSIQDQNQDGIVDIPYPINGSSSFDTAPWVKALPLLSTPVFLHPCGSVTVSGKITIEWSRVYDPLRYLIKYSLYYSSDAGKSWKNIALNQKEVLCTWDTTTVEDGSQYKLKIVATCLEGFTSQGITFATFTISNDSQVAPTPGLTIFLFSIALFTIVLFRKFRRKNQIKEPI